MGPGDFFGEGGVVSSQPRGESVRAATPVKVKIENATSMFLLIRHHVMQFASLYVLKRRMGWMFSRCRGIAVVFAGWKKAVQGQIENTTL